MKRERQCTLTLYRFHGHETNHGFGERCAGHESTKRGTRRPDDPANSGGRTGLTSGSYPIRGKYRKLGSASASSGPAALSNGSNCKKSFLEQEKGESNVKGRIKGLAVAVANLLAIPAVAGTQDWKVDGRQSTAQISIEARVKESRQTGTLERPWHVAHQPIPLPGGRKFAQSVGRGGVRGAPAREPRPSERHGQADNGNNRDRKLRRDRKRNGKWHRPHEYTVHR